MYVCMYVCIHMLYIISTSRGCPERNCRKIEMCETAGQTKKDEKRRSGWLRERIHGWRTVRWMVFVNGKIPSSNSWMMTGGSPS